MVFLTFCNLNKKNNIFVTAYFHYVVFVFLGSHLINFKWLFLCNQKLCVCLFQRLNNIKLISHEKKN